jgi:hypothetical protein
VRRPRPSARGGEERGPRRAGEATTGDVVRRDAGGVSVELAHSARGHRGAAHLDATAGARGRGCCGSDAGHAISVTTHRVVHQAGQAKISRSGRFTVRIADSVTRGTLAAPRKPSGDVKDPPHTHQSSLTLAAFRPWGSSARWCRTRGLPDSLTETPPGPETGGRERPRPSSPAPDSEPPRGVGYSSGAACTGCRSAARRIRLAAYGARLESVLGSRPRGFESPILRRPTGPAPHGAGPVVVLPDDRRQPPLPTARSPRAGFQMVLRRSRPRTTWMRQGSIRSTRSVGSSGPDQNRPRSYPAPRGLPAR